MHTSGSTGGQALVLGATGAFGSHTTMALLRRGWRVRALARDPEAARARLGAVVPVEWVAGDAMDAAAVRTAARGAQLIVHAVNPPAYRNWAGTVLPMLDCTLNAAAAEGATILAPGSVYNFAPDAGPAISEDAPQAPVTRKGALRVEWERRLAGVAGRGGRAILLRAGDFFGPGEANSALDWLVLRASGRPAAIFRPGRGNVRHAFAYLPDLAETAARLADRRGELAAFESFHFAGRFPTLDELVAAVRRACGRRLPALPFPWPMVGAMGAFDETLRELMEMRYLWRVPVGLDNAKLVRLLGEEPRTCLLEALRESLDLRPEPQALDLRRSQTSAAARFGTQQRKLMAR